MIFEIGVSDAAGKGSGPNCCSIHLPASRYMPSLVTSRTERAWQANLASPLTPSTADLKCASALAPSCVSAAARPSVLWIPETSSCAIILLSQPHDLADRKSTRLNSSH